MSESEHPDANPEPLDPEPLDPEPLDPEPPRTEPPRDGPPPVPPPLPPRRSRPRFAPRFRLPFGEVMGRCFSVVARNYFLFLLLSLVVYSPFFLGGYLFFRSDPDAMTTAWVGGIGLSILDSFFFNFVLAAALTWAVVEHLRGRPVRIGPCLSIGLSRFLPVLAISVLIVLAIAGTCIALFIPGIILSVVWYVATPVTVVERAGVFASCSRSAQLTRGDRWTIFGLAIVIALIVSFAGGLLYVIAGLVSGLNILFLEGEKRFWLSQGVTMFIRPFNAVIPAVIYYYLRTGKEGASVEDLVEVFE